MSLIPFPNVPNVPGVPSLLRHATVPTPDSLVNQGVSVLAAAVFGKEEWGVYKQTIDEKGIEHDDEKALKHDVFVSVSHKRTSTVSSYIMEKGAFASYNKAGAPFTCTIKLAVGEDQKSRGDFLKALEDMLTSTEKLYTIKTPEDNYKNVTLQSYSYDRTGQDGTRLITAELIFVEVREREQESKVGQTARPEAQNISFNGRLQQQFDEAGAWFQKEGGKLGAFLGIKVDNTPGVKGMDKIIGELPRWMVL